MAFPSSIILPRASKLAYPAGVAPGFDPSHPAAAGCRLSVVASGTSYSNLLNGKIGTVGGSPTSGLDGRIGKYQYCNGSTDVVTFSGMPTATDGVGSFGAIFVPITTGGTTKIYVYGTNSGNKGWALGVLNNGHVYTSSDGAGGAIGDSGLSVTANVPYFVASSGSVTLNKLNFVLTRLDNGSVTTSTVTPSPVLANSAFSSSWVVGGSNSLPSKAEIAALAYINQFMSPAQLLAWAADPWSFWYPRRSPIVMVGSSVSFYPYWATPSNYIPSGGYAT